MLNWAKLGGAVLCLIVGAAFGALVTGWQRDAAYSSERLAAKDNLHKVELAQARQEGAVDLLKNKEAIANQAREKAEQVAKDSRAASKARDAWISKLQGTCAENLKEAWGKL